MSNSNRHEPEQPTERTALLVARVPSISEALEPAHPPIEPVILRILAKGVASCDSSDWCPEPLSPPAVQTAFTLVVLLELKRRLSRRSNISSDIWEQWAKQQEGSEALHELDRHAVSVWTEYIREDRSIEEIERVLWQEFYYDDEVTLHVKVVDFLCQEDAPQKLLTHHLIYLSLCRTWKRGIQWHANGGREATVATRLLVRYDALYTPRVSHTMSLLLQLTYLALLAYFVLIPPRSASTEQPPRPHWHEALLMVYSGAQLLQGWSVGIVPYILVSLAFFSHLPAVPHPDDLAYGVLLVAFSWHILELHVPRSPTPLLLFPFSTALPLATLIWHGISRIFFPVMTFFLPALLLSLFLLSTSMSDIISGLARALDPAPIQTRVAFLTLFSVLFLLLLCSIFMLVLVYPSVTADTPSSPWDRYSKTVGLEARRAFVRFVVQHSVHYAFPAPLNVLQLAIQLSAYGLTVLGRKKAADQLYTVQRWIWRLAIGPLVVLVSAAWLWNLVDLFP